MREPKLRIPAAKTGTTPNMKLFRDDAQVAHETRALSPHAAHACSHIHAHALAGRPRRGLQGRNGPGRGREEVEDVAWHEACPRRINMPVALRTLLMREKPLRHDEV